MVTDSTRGPSFPLHNVNPQSGVQEIYLAATALLQLDANHLPRPLSLSSETEARALAVIPSFPAVLLSPVGNLQSQDEHLGWRE